MEIRTIEEGLAYLGVGIKDDVYVITDNNIVSREIITSGISIQAACDLKEAGRLFLTRKEANDAVDMSKLKSKPLTELFTLQQMVMEVIQSKLN